uniref:Uncharacterized protein n=1 Tax=Anguilla anguilla TaxID=7936 RepID=A0A0E9TUA6_ANGAN
MKAHIFLQLCKFILIFQLPGKSWYS